MLASYHPKSPILQAGIGCILLCLTCGLKHELWTL